MVTFGNISNRIPRYLSYYFNVRNCEIHRRKSRNNNDFILEKVNLECTKRVFFYKGAKFLITHRNCNCCNLSFNVTIFILLQFVFFFLYFLFTGPALIAVYFFLKLIQQSCINMFKLLLLCDSLQFLCLVYNCHVSSTSRNLETALSDPSSS